MKRMVTGLEEMVELEASLAESQQIQMSKGLAPLLDLCPLGSHR